MCYFLTRRFNKIISSRIITRYLLFFCGVVWAKTWTSLVCTRPTVGLSVKYRFYHNIYPQEHLPKQYYPRCDKLKRRLPYNYINSLDRKSYTYLLPITILVLLYFKLVKFGDFEYFLDIFRCLFNRCALSTNNFEITSDRTYNEIVNHMRI